MSKTDTTTPPDETDIQLIRRALGAYKCLAPNWNDPDLALRALSRVEKELNGLYETMAGASV